MEEEASVCDIPGNVSQKPERPALELVIRVAKVAAIEVHDAVKVVVLLEVLVCDSALG